MDNTRILIVEDEETLCEALRFNLEAEGYAVDVAHTAEEAMRLDLTRYSLVLLDVMMGEMSGFEMAAAMRQNPATARVPIIFCTALDSEEQMVGGLDIGADDYITKPYSIKNVLARVRSVLRRATIPEQPTTTSTHRVLECDTLRLDLDSKRCTVDGEEVLLPRKEFEILALLLGERGRIFSREEILSRVWPDEVVVLDRVVDVNITRLRRKIGRYGKMIITRSGYGYGFSA